MTIGDDVEIGANTTVDRGALNDTVIEDDANRIEELNVRGQTRSVVVTTLQAGAPWRDSRGAGTTWPTRSEPTC